MTLLKYGVLGICYFVLLASARRSPCSSAWSWMWLTACDRLRGQPGRATPRSRPTTAPGSTRTCARSSRCPASPARAVFERRRTRPDAGRARRCACSTALRDAAALDDYLREHAPRLRAEGIARFGDGFRADAAGAARRASVDAGSVNGSARSRRRAASACTGARGPLPPQPRPRAAPVRQQRVRSASRPAAACVAPAPRGRRALRASCARNAAQQRRALGFAAPARTADAAAASRRRAPGPAASRWRSLSSSASKLRAAPAAGPPAAPRSRSPRLRRGSRSAGGSACHAVSARAPRALGGGQAHPRPRRRVRMPRAAAASSRRSRAWRSCSRARGAWRASAPAQRRRRPAQRRSRQRSASASSRTIGSAAGRRPDACVAAIGWSHRRRSASARRPRRASPAPALGRHGPAADRAARPRRVSCAAYQA